MSPENLTTLFHEIMRARQRIYRLAKPTPLEPVQLPGAGEVFLKREDLSPIHSYKWRGAFNKMSLLSPEELGRGVVAASAGNHAQGVALSARHLGCHAHLFMPRSTPRMKIREVERLGGENATIVVEGDTYDEASALATAHALENGSTRIPPYDDLQVMAGQGMIGDEIVMAGIDPDVVFLQVGGGGMAAASACVLKTANPNVRIVGVEAEGQAAMARAIEHGGPVELEELDTFCDGTAVRIAGRLTYPLCARLIDEFVTVSNDEVCAAIQLLWESARLISEPSGALGVAAAMKHRDMIQDKRSVCVLSGANMDFVQLAWIARHAGVGLAKRRYFQFEIAEGQGTLLRLLDSVMEDISIIDFQYGKVDEKVARPVIGFEASPMQLRLFIRRLDESAIAHKDVTTREDAEFRIIHYRSGLFRHPYFAVIEFPERAGALREFLRRTAGLANVCYFNYTSTGEQVGRALTGLEFSSEAARVEFIDFIEAEGPAHRELSEDVLRAIL